MTMTISKKMKSLAAAVAVAGVLTGGAAALMPTFASASRGADDAVGHVRHSGNDDATKQVRKTQGADDAIKQVRKTQGADDAIKQVRQSGKDDATTQVRKARGADDAPGHVRHGGNDDGVGHS